MKHRRRDLTSTSTQQTPVSRTYLVGDGRAISLPAEACGRGACRAGGGGEREGEAGSGPGPGGVAVNPLAPQLKPQAKELVPAPRSIRGSLCMYIHNRHPRHAFWLRRGAASSPTCGVRGGLATAARSLRVPLSDTQDAAACMCTTTADCEWCIALVVCMPHFTCIAQSSGLITTGRGL
jgi:hypothetical protein